MRIRDNQTLISVSPIGDFHILSTPLWKYKRVGVVVKSLFREDA